MAISSSTLTIGSAEIGSGGGGSRWDTGAAPIRYPDPNIQVLDPRFTKYILPMAAIERIAGGCRFTEGPVWFGDGRYLLFSDIPNDRILKWEEETGAVSVFRQSSNYANGNTRDRIGRLITCEMDAQRLTRTEDDGRIAGLAHSFDGKRLTGPNDVVVKSDGTIWFSDNGAGIRGNYLGHKAEQELPFRVYRIDPRAREITVAVGDMERPNGLAFSPDESKLYVVDTPGGDKTVHVYDVVDDGTRVANGRVFFNAMPGDAGLCRWHSCRHRRQCLVRLFRRRRRGRRCGVRAGRRFDRPHPVARALRQFVFRRPEAQPAVHGGKPIGLFPLCRDAGSCWRLSRFFVGGADATNTRRAHSGAAGKTDWHAAMN